MRSPSNGPPRRRGAVAGLLALILSACSTGPSASDLDRVQRAVEASNASVVSARATAEKVGEFGKTMIVRVLVNDGDVSVELVRSILGAIYDATATGYASRFQLWCYQATSDSLEPWDGKLLSLAPALREMGLPATGSGWDIYSFDRSDLEALLDR